MQHKCIEPEGMCRFKVQFGHNFYCGLNHAPNHLWKSVNGHVYSIDVCAEKEAA